MLRSEKVKMFLQRVLNFEVQGLPRRGRPESMWKRQILEEGLKKEEEDNTSKWRKSVQNISV